MLGVGVIVLVDFRVGFFGRSVGFIWEFVSLRLFVWVRNLGRLNIFSGGC